MNPKIYGPNLHTTSLPHSFVFEGGGMGDYINWATSLKYIAETYTHVDATIFSSGLFLDVLKYLFSGYPGWKVVNRDEFLKHHVQGAGVCAPKRGTQLLNACGAHLMDLGFHYFLCLDKPPEEYNHLIPINYTGPWKWPELDPSQPYCIFTPGSTVDVREMPVAAFNELCRYAKSKGITPVFLGKAELSDNYTAKFLNYDFSLGVDLRERTNLLEATQIISGAKFIVGIDNGLLHIAGCTTTPIIFGHNITAIEHRNIRRKKGLTINITVDETKLPCIGCQSKVRFVTGQDFRWCVFKDNPDLNKKCLPMLFRNHAQVWKEAIDLALHEDPKKRKEPATVDFYA